MQLDSQASFWEARRAKLLADAARKAADLDSLRLRDTILHEALSKERQLAAASGGAPPAIAPHAEPAREAAAEPPHISELQERVASLEDELEAAQRLLEGLAEETRRTLAAALSRDARRQLLGFGEELRSDGEGGLHRVHSTARVLGSCVAATRVVRCRHRQQAAQQASALFVLTH